MCARLFLLLWILTLPYGAFATGGCLLTDALKDPRLANNPQFWDDYARLNNSKLSSEGELEKLIKRYQITETAAQAPQAQFAASRTLKILHKAEKEIQHLPKNLKQKIDEFISIATAPNGLNELLHNPGRWHYEKLPQFGDNAHSVRLNDGYRILFDVVDDRIDLRRVNKGHIHGN